MAKIIAFANQKGGVAKTTSVHNIAAALSNLERKVLMIDFDSQASLTISAGLEPVEHPKNIVSALRRDNPLSVGECVYNLRDGFYLLPSIIDLATLEMDMISRTSREKILFHALQPVLGDYDYILIDCPPQLSILTINALACADEVIIPVKTDYLSYRGLTQLMDTISDVRQLLNNRLEMRGIIATLYEANAKDDNDILRELQKNYPVLGVIRKMVIARKGIYDGLSAVEYDPDSRIARGYSDIAHMI